MWLWLLLPKAMEFLVSKKDNNILELADSLKLEGNAQYIHFKPGDTSTIKII